MPKHKGGTTEERKVLQTGVGLALMAASISWGQGRLVERVDFFKTEGFLKMGCFESGRLSLQVTLPGNHVHLHFGGKVEDCSLSSPQEGGIADKC